jgi:hypothetical protein
MFNQEFERLKQTTVRATTLVDDTSKKSKGITEELEKNAAKVVVSNYATIFHTQEEYHSKIASKWLGFAITSILLVIIFLLLSFTYDWFHITSTF